MVSVTSRAVRWHSASVASDEPLSLSFVSPPPPPSVERERHDNERLPVCVCVCIATTMMAPPSTLLATNEISPVGSPSIHHHQQHTINHLSVLFRPTRWRTLPPSLLLSPQHRSDPTSTDPQLRCSEGRRGWEWQEGLEWKAARCGSSGWASSAS